MIDDARPKHDSYSMASPYVLRCNDDMHERYRRSVLTCVPEDDVYGAEAGDPTAAFREVRTVTAVIYIAGVGRSGSTLLERLLSTADGVVSVGELRWIWTRGFGENQLCSCGLSFLECPFWASVVEEAFGSSDNVDAEALKASARRVDRLRYIPLHVVPAMAPHDFSARRNSHGRLLERLYSAIGSVAKARVIVDTSKEPSYAFLLRTVFGVDLFVVHLIRDSRAVAFSWQRVRQRPEIVSETLFMPRYALRRTSRDWIETNLLLEVYEKACGNLMRVRYEDLAARPEEVTNNILDRAERCAWPGAPWSVRGARR